MVLHFPIDIYPQYLVILPISMSNANIFLYTYDILNLHLTLINHGIPYV